MRFLFEVLYMTLHGYLKRKQYAHHAWGITTPQAPWYDRCLIKLQLVLMPYYFWKLGK